MIGFYCSNALLFYRGLFYVSVIFFEKFSEHQKAATEKNRIRTFKQIQTSSTMNTKQGTLYIVSTPIGNLKDITIRAIEILKQVSLIAAEDCRHTMILTKHYNIVTPITSFYSYNQLKKLPFLIEKLQSGDNIALVSDAGTPGISDPGYLIIKEAIQKGINVVPIPGPAALIAALTISGKPTDKFVFRGFLSNKPGKRKNQLKDIKEIGLTTVVYEAPHRLQKTLADIKDVFGNVEVVCARELTKKFEEIKRDSVENIIDCYSKQTPKGEFTIII